MTFLESIKICFSKYVVWKGRASRSEYWWFALFSMLGSIALSIVDAATLGLSENGSGLFSGLFSLAMFLPSLSVMVRRFHDTDRSGWWFWLLLVPIVGWVIVIVFLATKGTDGDNSYGHDPLDGEYRNMDDDRDDGADLSRSNIPPVNRG
ncbi:MAG: uncharacterized membrane protein YhaH (DUF805 family) [Paracoccaceae bacterium]|jgi:uncharacterized membrane protein YhaH (DUF805 family)